jgi:hypothetical protein
MCPAAFPACVDLQTDIEQPKPPKSENHREGGAFDDWLRVRTPKGAHLNIYNDFRRKAPKKILFKNGLGKNVVLTTAPKS